MSLLMNVRRHPWMASSAKVESRANGWKVGGTGGKSGEQVGSQANRPQSARSEVMQATFTASSTEAPRERSHQGPGEPLDDRAQRLGAAPAAGQACRRCCRRPGRERSARWPFPPTGEVGELSAADRLDEGGVGLKLAVRGGVRASSARKPASAARRTFGPPTGPSALPRVEYDRKATRASSPTMRRRARHDATAISASWSAVGSGTMAESAKVSTSASGTAEGPEPP